MKYLANQNIIIIDAAGIILGRLSSSVAKMLMNGKEVIILNAEKVVLSGKQGSILKTTISFFGTRSLGSLEKSPRHPRKPDGMIRRAVRGMLPWRKPTGKKCFRKLKVYIGVPEKFKDCKPQKLSIPSLNPKSPRITTADLAKEVGWNPGGN